MDLQTLGSALFIDTRPYTNHHMPCLVGRPPGAGLVSLVVVEGGGGVHREGPPDGQVDPEGVPVPILGALDRGPQCRLSILRNDNVPILLFF